MVNPPMRSIIVKLKTTLNTHLVDSLGSRTGPNLSSPRSCQTAWKTTRRKGTEREVTKSGIDSRTQRLVKTRIAKHLFVAPESRGSEDVIKGTVRRLMKTSVRRRESMFPFILVCSLRVLFGRGWDWICRCISSRWIRVVRALVSLVLDAGVNGDVGTVDRVAVYVGLRVDDVTLSYLIWVSWLGGRQNTYNLRLFVLTNAVTMASFRVNRVWIADGCGLCPPISLSTGAEDDKQPRPGNVEMEFLIGKGVKLCERMGIKSVRSPAVTAGGGCVAMPPGGKWSEKGYIWITTSKAKETKDLPGCVGEHWVGK